MIKELKIKESLVKGIPSLPGVYIMKNVKDDVIYVGKAISLKKRVQSYFNRAHDTKTSHLVADIHNIEYIITDNEIEALILECNLIKKYMPRYNIELKDDKKYPYIKITLEKFPRVSITRDIRKKTGLYFGPYTNVKSLRENMRFIRDFFPVRTCKNLRDKRACLNYHIKKCFAPCENKISEQEYQKIIDELKLFLEGKSDELISVLETKMDKFSEEMDFESAARTRDQINAIKEVFEKQKVEIASNNDEDAISLVAKNGINCITVFFFRDGKLVGERHFFVYSDENTVSEILTEFVKRFYSSNNSIPKSILLEYQIEEEDLIIQWLRKKRGNIVNLFYPKRGEKLYRVEMTKRNAKNFLQVEIEKQKKKQQTSHDLLLKLKLELGLDKFPLRIEAFDISNLSGTEAVGSMIVFQNGESLKKDYRRFKIREVKGIDDYRMMQEVIRRRYSGTLKEKLPFPDLIIIDGGPGQLNAAQAELKKMNLLNYDIISLAKQFEEIYTPSSSHPIRLSDGSPTLLLLQNIRDEAHRFALKYHKLLRGKRILRSS